MEKRLIILPRGLELKKCIGARETLLSVAVWRPLLRLTKIAPMRKEASPAVPSEASEIIVNLTRLAEFSCSERGAEAH